MARIAGLRLKERWDGWNRDPFTDKRNVVSVYGRWTMDARKMHA